MSEEEEEENIGKPFSSFPASSLLLVFVLNIEYNWQARYTFCTYGLSISSIHVP